MMWEFWPFFPKVRHWHWPEKVWLALSTRIHPKHVLLGWGQDSVLANQVLPHQCVFRLCALLCSPVGTVRFVRGVKLPKISRYGEVLRVWLQLRGWAQVLFNSNTLFLSSSEMSIVTDSAHCAFKHLLTLLCDFHESWRAVTFLYLWIMFTSLHWLLMLSCGGHISSVLDLFYPRISRERRRPLVSFLRWIAGFQILRVSKYIIMSRCLGNILYRTTWFESCSEHCPVRTDLFVLGHYLQMKRTALVTAILHGCPAGFANESQKLFSESLQWQGKVANTRLCHLQFLPFYITLYLQLLHF